MTSPQSDETNTEPSEIDADIPIHGRKALEKLEGLVIQDASPSAGGGVELETKDGTIKLQSLMDEVTIEFWEDN